MWGSRSFARTAVAAALLIGCQAGPPASPAQTPASSSTPVATPPPTSAPVPTVGPSGSAIACPTNLPLTLRSVDELADRMCYGTKEVAIDGWLSEHEISLDHGEATPDWVMPISALRVDRPTVGEFILDYLMAGPSCGLDVVTLPATEIDLSGLGRWVKVRGHFNDPAALACTPALVDTYPDEFAGPDCDRLFVVTALDPLERAAPSCPTESPMVIETFLAADATCFIGREVEISGWEDVGEGFGGASFAYPVSLGDLRSTEAQLVANRWESDLSQTPIFPMVVAGSGVSFDADDRRVIVTGKLGHEASASCRPARGPWTWVPPDAWAQHRCMRLFVITRVQVVG